MSNNLLEPVSVDAKLCKEIKMLIETPEFKPAFDMLNSIPQIFIDKDGNFRKQFQTTEFNQRFWELLLYKVFNETGFNIIESDHEYPDFELEKGSNKLFVEAVTTNPTQNDKITPILLKGIKSNLAESIKAYIGELLLNQYSVKISNALYNKLKKKYWENEWVKNAPLIIAIEAFHNPYTTMIPDSKIIEYLYKTKLIVKVDSEGNQKSEYQEISEVVYGNQKKPAGFFQLEDSEFISAVIFYNERPLWKFNRMGYLNGEYENILMQRYGYKYDPSLTALKPMDYSFNVNNESHNEIWNEGISIFHNPNANIPLDRKLFEGYRQFWVADGKYDGFMPDFFPFTSQTIMLKEDN